MNKKDIKNFRDRIRTAQYLKQQGSTFDNLLIESLLEQYPLFQMWPNENDDVCYICGKSPLVRYDGDRFFSLVRHMGCVVHPRCQDHFPTARFGL